MYQIEQNLPAYQIEEIEQNLPAYQIEEIEQNFPPPGLQQIVLEITKRKYVESRMRAQANYRRKFPEKYCKLQRDLYERKKQDPVWKAHCNERARENAKKNYQKKKEEKIAQGIEIKPRGRPRKSETIEKNEIISEFFEIV